jgi:hypothetical protein
MQHLQKKKPRHRVEGFRYIQLEENSGLFLGVKKAYSLLYHHEIILNEPSFDKGTLIG